MPLEICVFMSFFSLFTFWVKSKYESKRIIQVGISKKCTLKKFSSNSKEENKLKILLIILILGPKIHVCALKAYFSLGPLFE
jgi:hypothetical protein